MAETKTYTVEGMHCEHCRLSVTEELLEVPGIEAVDIDLASGRLTVHGDELDDAAVAAAVDEAGYRVTS